MLSPISQPIRPREIGGTTKRLRRTTKKKNLTRITTRTIRFCWVPRSNSVGLPLARSLPRSVIRNVAAFRHHILSMRKSRWETNRTSTAIHLPDPTTPRSLGPPLLTRPALKEIQKVMIGWGLQANNLGWSSSASNRVERRDSRRKRYKARAWKASQQHCVRWKSF